MSEQEFELYLKLLARCLRLTPGQRDQIADELRDHLQERLEELVRSGLSRDQAVVQALDEFGDASVLAAHFTTIAQWRRRKLFMRLSLGSVAALTIVLFGAMAFWPDNATVQGPNHVIGETTVPGDDVADSFKVKVAQPIAREVADSVISNGLLEPSQSVEIRARVTGYLLTADFPTGGSVKKGDHLFKLDGQSYEAELSKAKAESQRAQAYADRNKNEFEAYNQAKNKGAEGVTELMLQSKRSDWVEAKASWASAQADIEIAQINVNYTNLTAPIAGRLSRPAVDVGNLVTANQTTLATLATVDPLVVHFTMSFDAYARLRQAIRDGGLKLSEIPVGISTSNDAGFHDSAKLESLEGDTVMSGQVRVRATLPNPDMMLLPGLSPLVRVATSKPYPALLVPMDAVPQFDQNGHGYVLVVNEQNIVVKRDVILGTMEGKFHVVRSGLKPNDWVVLEAAKLGLELGGKIETTQTSLKP
ncbi:MAG TPA: efflux RND transporter periplasmic adaptor subunit [Pirellulales bacterium]|jgi:multidrug efflux system membrane fusion protein